jgi:DNA-binding NtrC family response regulator
LRERISDIDDLAYFFLKKCTSNTNKKITTISKEYIDLLKQHHWKGNIRELRNVIERSIILTENELTKEILPFEILQLNKTTSKEKMLSAFELASAEKIHIQKVLNYTNGNKTKTAELLGIALTTLYRKLSEYGLNNHFFKTLYFTLSKRKGFFILVHSSNNHKSIDYQ